MAQTALSPDYRKEGSSTPLTFTASSPSIKQQNRLSKVSIASSAFDGDNVVQDRGQWNRASTSSNKEGQPSHHAHRFERLLVVRAVPTKVRHPLDLQVQALAPAQAPNDIDTISRSSTHASSFGAVAEASVAGQDNGTTTYMPPVLTKTSPVPSVPPTATSSTNGTATPVYDEDRALTLPSGAEAGESLSRSNSVRSNRSTRSSIGSTSSTASGMSSRRVYPVYNLEFHALHASVVIDAGTDEKVARVHKRGVEIVDFALLDPVFYGQHMSVPTYLRRREEARKAAEAARVAASNSSFAQDFKPSNLLNKFKRLSFRTNANASSPAASSVGNASPSSSSKRPSLLRSTASEVTTVGKIPIVPLFREREKGSHNDGGHHLLPLGKNTLESIAPQPTKHAPGYVWLVRSFLRKDLVDSTELLDMTVEWRKKRRSSGRAPQRPRGDSTATKYSQSTTASRRASVIQPEDEGPGQPQQMARSLSKRLAALASNGAHQSGASRVGTAHDPLHSLEGFADNGVSAEDIENARTLSPNSTRRPSNAPQDLVRQNGRSHSPSPSVYAPTSISDTGHQDEQDDGNESDPEDSERPWICELVVRNPQSESGLGSPTQRVLLGTVTPAPHHPRLVAHLAIPLTLSPVNMNVKASKSIRSISIEEMKDMMTVTALWLIVRESLGLGGLKSRKNEGSWRLMEPAALRSDK